MMTTLPSISYQNVSFSFDGKTVLKDFSFSAHAGNHTVLKGESGSGKSTLLKLLLGFYNPSSGSILLNNSEDWDPRSLRKQTAWLPQDLDLGAGTVQEVMAKPFSFAENKSQENFKKSTTETLQRLGLNPDILNKQFRDLSTGQRQRIGLAICYLLDKSLLLLDEPTSSLDKASKQKVADLLLDNKKTVISTSHDPFWVDLADTVINLP